MFRKVTRACLLLLGIATLLWGFFLTRVRPSELAEIAQKVKAHKEASASTLFSTTQQQRKDVVKEIWFTQEDHSRLHYRIFSASSLLTIKPEGKGFDLIEKLENMQCWMQDKLYPPTTVAGPTQQIRFLAAEEGLYHYTSQEFLAQSVALSLYRMNGHDLPEKMGTTRPFLKGIAEGISFAISGKNPQFQAKQFKAELGDKQ